MKRALEAHRSTSFWTSSPRDATRIATRARGERTCASFASRAWVFAGVDASRRDDATRFGAVLEGFWFNRKTRARLRENNTSYNNLYIAALPRYVESLTTTKTTPMKTGFRNPARVSPCAPCTPRDRRIEPSVLSTNPPTQTCRREDRQTHPRGRLNSQTR